VLVLFLFFAIIFVFYLADSGQLTTTAIPRIYRAASGFAGCEAGLCAPRVSNDCVHA
jgi:hypothetical protein